MKNFTIFCLTICLVLGFSSCKKDNDTSNPFAGSVWKSRAIIGQEVSPGTFETIEGYDVYYFETEEQFSQYFQDVYGAVCKSYGKGNYSVDTKRNKLILNSGYGQSELDYSFTGGVPYFTDSGKTYYRQF